MVAAHAAPVPKEEVGGQRRRLFDHLAKPALVKGNSVFPIRRYHVRTARVAQMELHLHALGAVPVSFGSTGCSRKFHGAGSLRRALPRWAEECCRHPQAADLWCLGSPNCSSRVPGDLVPGVVLPAWESIGGCSMCGRWGHRPLLPARTQVTVGLVPEEVMLDFLSVPPDVQGNELC